MLGKSGCQENLGAFAGTRSLLTPKPGARRALVPEKSRKIWTSELRWHQIFSDNRRNAETKRSKLLPIAFICQGLAEYHCFRGPQSMLSRRFMSLVLRMHL